RHSDPFGQRTRIGVRLLLYRSNGVYLSARSAAKNSASISALLCSAMHSLHSQRKTLYATISITCPSGHLTFTRDLFDVTSPPTCTHPGFSTASRFRKYSLFQILSALIFRPSSHLIERRFARLFGTFRRKRRSKDRPIRKG